MRHATLMWREVPVSYTHLDVYKRQLLALQARDVAGGSVLAEQVFSIAGMGQLIMISVLNRDFLVIQAIVFVITVIVVFINLLLDVSYGWLDPRIRMTLRTVSYTHLDVYKRQTKGSVHARPSTYLSAPRMLQVCIMARSGR